MGFAIWVDFCEIWGGWEELRKIFQRGEKASGKPERKRMWSIWREIAILRCAQNHGKVRIRPGVWTFPWKRQSLSYQ